MKKADQENTNIVVECEYETAMEEIRKYHVVWNDCTRLRSCSAFVYETPNFYILRSYATIIAVIDKNDDTLYDYLRYVYGYTSTSAQHIAKFSHDYGKGKWGCADRRTWREI